MLSKPCQPNNDSISLPIVKWRSQIGDYLNSCELMGCGTEIGVFNGHFAEILLRTWHGKLLYLIDPWSPQPDYFDSWNATAAVMQRRFERTQRRLAPYSGRFRLVRKRSAAAAKEFRNGFFDFIYLDANHSFKAVSEDLASWYPKLRKGGLLAGHDFFDAIADDSFEPSIKGTFPVRLLTSYGVKSAVLLFAKAHNLSVSATDEKSPTWYFRKPW